MPRSRPRRSAPRHASQIVFDAVARRLSPARARLARIRGVWEDFVPASLARQVFPGSVRGETLTLFATNGQWLHEVRYLEADLLARLRAVDPPLGVERIRVRLCPRDVTPPPAPAQVRYDARPRAPVLSRAAEAPLPPSVTRALDEAPSDELRRVLEDTYRRIVARNAGR